MIAAEAQLVERQLPKLDVASSTLVSRSKIMNKNRLNSCISMLPLFAVLFLFTGCSDDGSLGNGETEEFLEIIYPAHGFNVSGEVSIRLNINSNSSVDMTNYQIAGVLDTTLQGKVETLPLNFSDSTLFKDGTFYSLIVSWWNDESFYSDSLLFKVDMLTIKRITSNKGNTELFNTVPTYTSDSLRVIVQSLRNGNMELFSIDNSALIDTFASNALNLSNNPKSDIMPSYWSAMNSVLYASNDSGSFQLRLLNLDPDELTVLTEDSTAEAFFPTGSNNGEFIFYEREKDGVTDIWNLRIDDLQASPLLFREGSDGHPSISPDNSRVVFHSDIDGSFDLWVKDVGSGEPLKLVDWSSAEKNPVWSPDGNYIAFTSDRAGNDDLWLLRVSDSFTIQMTSHPSDEDYAAFHPTKNELLFTAFRNNNQDIYRLEKIDKFY